MITDTFIEADQALYLALLRNEIQGVVSKDSDLGYLALAAWAAARDRRSKCI